MPFRRQNCPRLSIGFSAALVGLLAHIGVAIGAEGVLELRNGNLLRGNITLSGDHYRVDNTGASLLVPIAQVEAVCETLDQAYEQRRRERAGSSPDAHLELAHWCLRHNLLDQAAREILDVRTADPANPQLATLELLLRQSLQLEAARVQAAASPAKIAPSPAPQVDAPVGAGELNLSTEVQAQFVRSIQPMLIHNCTTGGCHQPGSDRKLQIDRWALEGRGSATLVRRNLASVAAQVNREDPASSTLLLRARQAHGAGASMSTALAPYQAALMLQWLNQAAGIEPEAAPDDAAPETFDDAGSVDLAAEVNSATPAVDPAASGAEKALERPFKPRDAFDPEIFNRRFAHPGDHGNRRVLSIPPPLPAAATGDRITGEGRDR